MLSDFQINKLLKVLDAKRQIIGESPMPDYFKTFFKCGLVLYRRQCYDAGKHTDDIFDCEIEYAKIPDERLLKNYNELYKLITLKHGEHF